jgi:peptidoglycan/xylan/chitin deacetylase (PgdA/CDA1 family)
MQSIEPHFKILDLDAFTERHERGQPLAGHIAITFDDGWQDTCPGVAAIAEREEWPITIYVPTMILEGRRTLWFAELPDLMRGAAGKRLEVDEVVLDLTSDQAAKSTRAKLTETLVAMPGGQAIELIDSLRHAAGLPRVSSEPNRFIGTGFIEKYARSEWIAFGSHTVDHQAPAVQPGDRLRWQLSESKAQLEAITGKTISHLCYPYGSPETIGETAPSIVREYYRSATTMVRGVCNAASDREYLPRISLYDGDSQLRFLAKLALADWV